MGTKGVCNVPVIDVEDFPGQSRKMIKACEDLGCFRIINHHKFLPQTLSSEMKAVARSLDLPVEIKQRNTHVIPGSGYVGPSHFSPHFEALVHNVDIACKMVEGMGLATFSFEEWSCQFKINKYNFTPETVDSCGLQIHTDSGFLAMLEDDENVGGLEVMDKSGSLVAVEPLPGSLLVILGDIATVWSNGRSCNVKHRVVDKEARTRLSIASFHLGPKGETVESPMELVDSSSQSRLFVPFTYEYYRNLRSSIKLYAGEAFDLVRTNS